MPTTRIPWRTFMRGLWLKGPKENTPTEHLRRAVSVFPLRGGSILSRSGSELFFSRDAHSLFKFAQNRVLGVEGQIYKGTTPGTDSIIGVTASGQPAEQNGNRLAFMEIPVQFLSSNPKFTELDYLFISGGGKPIKLDTSFNATDWGIRAPTAAQINAVTLNANATLSKQIETFESTASYSFKAIDPDTDTETAVSTNPADPPPTASIDTVHFLQGAGSLKLRVPKDTAVEATKGVTLDLTQFSAPGDSADQDYINFFVRCNRPKHIKNVEIKLFVGPGPFVAGTPNEDFFSKEIKVKVASRRRRRKLRSTGDLIPLRDQQKFLQENATNTKSDLSMAEFIGEDMTTISVVKRAWTSVTVPKATMDTSGKAGTSGFTFANVIGFQVSVETNKQGGSAVWFDDLKMVGGVGTRGDYLYTITFKNDTTGSRSNPPIDASGNILTQQIQNIDRQSIAVAGLPTSGAGFPFDPDAQISHVEIWRNIGNGGLTFFKAGEVTLGTTTFTDNRGDYIGMFSGSGTSGSYLDPTQLLTVDNAPLGSAFRDFITSTNTTDFVRQSVYYPPAGRVFALSNDFKSRLMISPQGRPESLETFTEPTTPDDPIERLVVWNEGLYIFTDHRVLQLVNTDEPFAVQDVLGAPGVITSTPVTGPPGGPQTVRSTPAGILYQALDGVRLFDGAISRIVADDSLAPIFRGSSTDGITAFNGVTASYGRDEYVITDVDNTTLALNVRTLEWRNVGLGANALYHERDTRILLASIRLKGTGKGVFIWYNSTSGITANTTNPFLSMGSAAVFAAEEPSTVPSPVTFNSMFIRLTANLGGGGTATWRLRKNGSPTALTVTIASGSSSGNTTGQSIAFSADDTIAMDVTFSGGTTSATILYVTMGYTTTQT